MEINDGFLLHTQRGLLRQIGRRAHERRIAERLSQAELAQRAGVSRDTIVRFEHGHNVATEALVRIAIALDAANELQTLFPPPERRTLDEIIREQDRPKRVRSRSPR